jgi:DNA-binding transcriptional LysR family regulator
MDRLESMSVFIAAVESGSLSAAGRRLGMPLATVSRKVSELESHLKARLLIRSTRKLSLTDAGEAYLAGCKRILEHVAEAERIASGEYRAPRGELVIAAPIVFGRQQVLPVVTQFLKAYPEVDVRLALGDRVLNILEDHIDVAVRIGELPDSRLVATRVGRVRQMICASAGYLKERGAPKRPEDLKKHDCITFAGLMSPDAWNFKAAKSEVSIPVHSRLVVNTAEAAIDAAVSGIGLTRVLSYQVEREIRDGALVTVLKKSEPAPIPVSLVYAGQRLLPLKLRAFLDFATPRLRQRSLGNI